MTTEEEEKTIFFADLSGFTALTEAHGDEIGTTVVRRFYDMTRGLLRNGAVLVKTIGDAVMLVAPDPETAVGIVLDLRSLTDSRPNFPTIRVGVHVGPAREAEGDYFGAAVNIAARVAAHASAGQILCTAAVATRMARTTLCEFVELGPVTFRNVQKPVVIYELRGQPAPPAVHVDPVCRMQVSSDSAAAWIRSEALDHYFCSLPCLRMFLLGQDKEEGVSGETRS